MSCRQLPRKKHVVAEEEKGTDFFHLSDETLGHQSTLEDSE